MSDHILAREYDTSKSLAENVKDQANDIIETAKRNNNPALLAYGEGIIQGIEDAMYGKSLREDLHPLEVLEVTLGGLNSLIESLPDKVEGGK